MRRRGGLLLKNLVRIGKRRLVKRKFNDRDIVYCHFGTYKKKRRKYLDSSIYFI